MPAPPAPLDDVLAPPCAPLDDVLAPPAPLDDVLAPPAPVDDALLPDDVLPVGVQHCSLAGPGQKPGVETWPGMVAQTDVSMQVPATPPTVQAGAPEELALLDACCWTSRLP